MELQHDQEQLNLRANISEVEAEERVYQMFEERERWSDDISPVKSSVKKSPPKQGPGCCGRGSDSEVKDAKIKHDVCRLCRGGHNLSACSWFKAMSPGEKLSFVWGKKLCFWCFDGRHVASQCRAGVVCDVEGCTAKHSKLLHQSFMRPVKENFGEQQTTPNPGASSHHIESHTHACSSPRQGQTKLALAIVPVKVRAKGQTAYHYTYALLDSGSNRTFCSESLIEKLDVKGKPANRSLTTVNSSESADVELVALEVVAAKSGAGRPSVKLPKVYMLPNLPTLENCIASDSNFRKWSHLKDLRLPQVDKSGVTILIGQDVPEALWPLELRKGKEGQPYATRARLGWSLNGPVESEPFV